MRFGILIIFYKDEWYEIDKPSRYDNGPEISNRLTSDNMLLVPQKVEQRLQKVTAEGE